MMRVLSPAEKNVIRAVAVRLPDGERKQLLEDMERATAEAQTVDGSRIIFQIAGYDRPPYRGQHPFPVEGYVQDQDGAEIDVLLHADENGRLFELELVRFAEGGVIGPVWNTLQFW
jgi:hypothetical protein